MLLDSNDTQLTLCLLNRASPSEPVTVKRVVDKNYALATNMTSAMGEKVLTQPTAYGEVTAQTCHTYNLTLASLFKDCLIDKDA